MRRVEGYGPSNARLVVVGEAPGGHEEQLGRPFVGPTGKIVRDCLSSAGIKPEEVYMTNVVKVRPPGNQIKLLKTIGYELSDFIPQLWEEINAIKPNCILAFGGTALTALTGMDGIEKYRGSILQSCYASTKVVPTIHPAALLHSETEGMHSWKDLTYIKWDVIRAVKQSQFPELRAPERNLITCRNNLDLYRFLNRHQSSPFVSVDIETFRTIPICIAFAFNSKEAISIPLFNNLAARSDGEQMTRSDLIQCWSDISAFLADCKVQKIGQNFKFDEKQLALAVNDTLPIGLITHGFFFDTMLAFRTLYPELPGSLAFQTSVLTEEPYYKEEGKGYNPKKDKVDRLLLYNAKDAVVTYECYERELEELESRGLVDFFFSKVMPLHPFYSRIERRGIRRDNFAKAFLDEKYKDLQKAKQDELNSLTVAYGVENVNVNSNGLNGQVGKLLFNHMALPLRKGTDEKTLDALRRNVLKSGTEETVRKRRILELILEIRKVRKTRGTYIDAKVHADGRLRTSYRIMLETGRTATGILQPPVTTEKMGLAFQTITKHGEFGSDLRSMFIPDPGYIFVEPDLSQAEARVVAVLARDGKLLKMFKFGVDIHRVTSFWVRGLNLPLLEEFFNVCDDNLSIDLARRVNAALKERTTEDERQIGKKFRHAGHYDMGKREAAEQIGISEGTAGIILQKFHATNPNIKGVFHREIIEFLNANNRMLTNPFGRVRQFLNKWGDDLFKEAYAQIPQSTVSDQVKYAMIRIERRAPWLEILEESHDSFLSQCPIELAEKTYPIIKEELEVPIDFSKCSLGTGELIIPCEIKIGKQNWQEMERVL